MAITYPRPAADWWLTLIIESTEPTLPYAINQSRTAGGEIVNSSTGDSLWSISAKIAPESNSVALQSQIRLLGQPTASFIATPLIGRTPSLDPLGTVAASNVTIGTLPTGDTTLGLAGLPAGYVISVDDYISWVVAGIYHFHQFAESGAADALGVLAALEVVPPILPDVAVGQAVVLVNPEIKCVLNTGATSEGSFGAAVLDGVTISATQTLR